ncbi:polysaccharide export outer membrane protein [Sphingomonas kaistensis]|uniref:Polysaccharide export outer membrane protein n=1 Tax=Sphingomonas kaistensis TaxID=298708 RepID=A0A7X6BGR1_9SPHN|nr:polysaccharide biosynthesis/export family protein [Sphingomonas kaistensis]NJC06128.1 polysaccharide export outer membrane protein [Sphingomonas kaistensis]
MRSTLKLPVFAAGSLALALGACADKPGGPIPYNVTLAPPDQPRALSLEENYRIAPLDTVTVNVFRQKDLSGDYEVDLTGRISMPLIGSIEAVDLTTAQLDQKVTAAYAKKYLVNPDVAVGVKSSTRRAVTVDGAVKSSGSYPINGPLTLLQAIALSGGASEDANLRRVAVFRTVSGQRQAAAFDLQQIRRGQAVDPPIYAGDIVVVDGSGVKDTQKRILNNIPILSIFRPF